MNRPTNTQLLIIVWCTLTCISVLQGQRLPRTRRRRAARDRAVTQPTVVPAACPEPFVDPIPFFEAPEPPKEPEKTLGREESVIEELPPQAKVGRAQKTVEEFDQPPLRPATAIDDPLDKIEVNFEETDLANVTSWISELFGVSFLTSDAITPPQAGGAAAKRPPTRYGPQPPTGGQKVGGSIQGHKLTFKSHIPLTKRQVWDLFVIFLDLSGLAVRSSSIRENFYQVVPATKGTDPQSILNQPLPSYVNVDWRALPENDMYVRYVYFLQNTKVSTIEKIVQSFIDTTSANFNVLQTLDAFMITDKAYNIRSLMQVVQELDGVALPEAMSVLRLQNANATDVQTLYNDLTDEKQPQRRVAQFLGKKNIPTKAYFPPNIKMVVEERTNSLIILGDRKGIKKVEEFIIKYVDTELDLPYSPLYVYNLQYTDAHNMAEILKKVVENFGGSGSSQATQDASKYGSVIGGEKYLQPMVFTAEPEGNRLLVKAEKQDWLMVKRIIEQLDVPQPQVAIEVLVVDVRTDENRELGVQIRNKRPDQISKNIDWQMSGLPNSAGQKSRPIVVPNVPPGREDAGSIAANLIELAQGQSVGSTLISIGTAATGGVWALFKLLQTHSHTEVVSNPYLVATNKYEALISLGETRRVTSSVVVSGDTSRDAMDDKTAALTVKVTPQINREGIINLTIFFELSSFTSAADSATNADTAVHRSQTNANVADGEVLAFGGFLLSNMMEQVCKTPLLGDVPVLGWFFKNKTKLHTKDNILVFISPHIVEPRLEGGVSPYSEYKMNDAKQTLCESEWPNQKRDPIHRWFFKDHTYPEIHEIDEFVAQKAHERNTTTETLIVGDNAHAKRKPLVTAQAADTPKKSSRTRRHKKTSLTEFVPEQNRADHEAVV